MDSFYLQPSFNLQHFYKCDHPQIGSLHPDKDICKQRNI